MRKYMLRSQLHPEILSRGAFSGQMLKAVGRHLEDSRIPCSGEVGAYLSPIGDTDVTHAQMFWALHQWNQCSKPVYYIEPGLAEALTHTDIPVEKLWDIRLPEKAIYIALPPIFMLDHYESGQHPVEGIYLVHDWAAVRKGADGEPSWANAHTPKSDGQALITNFDEGFLHMEAISLIGIGASRGSLQGMKEARDDAVITTSLVPGMPMNVREYYYGGCAELIRVVVNLFYMMQKTTALEREVVTPTIEFKGGKERNKRRAEEKAHEDGKSLLPYTILRLSSKARSIRSDAPTKESLRKLKYETWVSGHFHDYWVLTPADEKVSETKEGVGGQLSRITKFITPYKMGEGLPSRPVKTVLVKA